MQKFNAKTIITASGVILLLIAGALTMLLMPSEQNASNQNVQLQAQPVVLSSTMQTPNSQPQNQPSKIWYVYVTGAVKSPGVYKLSEDSRVFQAIEAAGGFTLRADEASLNLAGPLADGVHVHVAVKGERSNSPAIPGVPSQPVHARGLVDVNNASESDLQKLDGVGPALSKRIIEYRQAHGNFARPEDLLKVKGIGQALLSKIRGQIQAGTQTASSYIRTSQSSGNLIDINNASELDLQKLDGVGPALSKRIIEYRQAHGNFARPEDLLKVKGIGQAKLNKIRSQIQIRQ